MKGVTAYQLEIIQHVAAADDAEPLDFDQLLEKLSWHPSKESAQFPIRSLVTKGLLRKDGELRLRRGRRRVVYQLTEEGKRVLDPRVGSGKGDSFVPGSSRSGKKVVGKLSTETANFEHQSIPDEDFGLPPELSFE